MKRYIVLVICNLPVPTNSITTSYPFNYVYHDNFGQLLSVTPYKVFMFHRLWVQFIIIYQYQYRQNTQVNDSNGQPDDPNNQPNVPNGQSNGPNGQPDDPNDQPQFVLLTYVHVVFICVFIFLWEHVSYTIMRI